VAAVVFVFRLSVRLLSGLLRKFWENVREIWKPGELLTSEKSIFNFGRKKTKSTGGQE